MRDVVQLAFSIDRVRVQSVIKQAITVLILKVSGSTSSLTVSRFRIPQHESEMNSLGNHKNSCQCENLTFVESVSTVQTTDRMVQGYNYRSNCLRITVNYTMEAFSGKRFELRYDTNRSVMAW